MILKVFSCVALGAVVLAGVALVSKAESPGRTVGGGGSTTVGTADVETISRGETVTLEDHVQEDGVFTIFDFTADW